MRESLAEALKHAAHLERERSEQIWAEEMAEQRAQTEQWKARAREERARAGSAEEA